MGFLDWLFGRSTPAITFSSFSTPVSTAPSNDNRLAQNETRTSPAPAKPSEPKPTRKTSQAYSEGDDVWRDLQREGLKWAKEKYWSMYALNHSDKAFFLRNEGKSKRALELFLETIYLGQNGPQDAMLPWEKHVPPWLPSTGKISPCYMEAAWGEAQECEMDIESIKALFLNVAAKQHQALSLPLAPEEAWPKLKDALDSYIAQIEAEEVAKHAAKEAKRLQREAERDVRRAERSAATALEREQKKAARLIERQAKRTAKG
jgi:hypothetical protein